MTPIHLLISILLILPFDFVLGDDWPAFRGANHDGITKEEKFPTEWGKDKNILWKVPLPGENNGSPIVSSGRIFLTSAIDQGRKRTLLCFESDTGKELWRQTVEFDQVMPTHKTNLYGGTTPAADAKRVVVWHGSAGLFAYDFSGKELWGRQLGEFRHMWGYGGSPIIYKNRVYLHAGPGKDVFLVALDLNTGKEIWRVPEPVEGSGERNLENKYMGSWSTPVLAKSDSKNVIVCSFATRVRAFEPVTGNVVWTCDGIRGPKGDLCYTSPVIADNICVAMGGFGGPAIGFKMSGTGNITEKERLWRTERGPQRIGSGVFTGGCLYMANAGPNILECIDPATGKPLWRQRSPGVACWGSMVLAGNLIYVTDQQGDTLVINPNREKFELVHLNRLSDPGNSTPAFSNARIFIRTFRNLYCIENR